MVNMPLFGQRQGYVSFQEKLIQRQENEWFYNRVKIRLLGFEYLDGFVE
ncbi:Uncharacterised protein [Raoultella ornithinolytica]|nr:Uncharacterised protein [Raoultella ornithinolytica]